MRLICVPLWLSQTLKHHGLPESALLDRKTLSPYLATLDLDCYNTLYIDVNEYLEKTFGVQDVAHNAVALIRAVAPFKEMINDSIAAQIVRDLEKSQETKGLDYAMTGRHLPAGYYWSLSARPLNGTQGDSAIGLFVYLIEGTIEDKTKADAAFLSELLELLYAHNLTIEQLAQTGFLGAYINRLA